MLNNFHEYVSCPDCFKFRHLNSVRLENVHHPLKALCPLMNLTVFLNSQAYLSYCSLSPTSTLYLPPSSFTPSPSLPFYVLSLSAENVSLCHTSQNSHLFSFLSHYHPHSTYDHILLEYSLEMFLSSLLSLQIYHHSMF